ncbi:1-(5-phosphoribosyl)-5-[(5-phosphoribosylamino)methylideneamino]imidazole-4-carboxamide isomerase [Chloroflexota bacterium]
MPAIDIRGGNCVNLYQGDYNEETVFSDDPVEVALRWQSLGATRIHVVDLDGAANAESDNFEIINNLATAIWVPVQLGGGIRSLETIQRWLKAGIERVILGTAAVENPALVKEACRLYGDCIMAGIDTRDGKMTIHGWQQETQVEGVAFAREMARLGVKRFLYTDVVRTGTLTEPNFTAFSELANEIRLPVIVAGGVSSLVHLKMLKQLGAEGAIIGKALYTGDINLKEALATVS